VLVVFDACMFIKNDGCSCECTSCRIKSGDDLRCDVAARRDVVCLRNISPETVRGMAYGVSFAFDPIALQRNGNLDSRRAEERRQYYRCSVTGNTYALNAMVLPAGAFWPM